MDGMIFDHDAEEEEQLHVHTGSFTSEDVEDNDKDKDGKGKKGKQGGAAGTGGIFDDGKIYFDRDEMDGFDATELQGLPYYDFVSARRKGLPLRSRMTEQAEQYLKTFLDDPALRAHVLEVASSENGHPTLLLDTGSIIQFQLYANDLERVRVSADIEPEIGVAMAIRAFQAAGKSINPNDVKFGLSERFKAVMEPEWKRQYAQIQKSHPTIDLGTSSRKSAPRAAAAI